MALLDLSQVSMYSLYVNLHTYKYLGRRRVKRKWNQRGWITDPSANWQIIIEIQTRDEDDIVESVELPLVDCMYVARAMVCDAIHEVGDAKGWHDGKSDRVGGGGWKGYEGATGSAALIKLAEDNEPVCRLACLAV